MEDKIGGKTDGARDGQRDTGHETERSVHNQALEEHRQACKELDMKSGVSESKPRSQARSIQNKNSVANIDDLLSGISDTKKMTSEWVNKTVASLDNKKLDSRSLLDAERLQHRRQSLSLLQQ